MYESILRSLCMKAVWLNELTKVKLLRGDMCRWLYMSPSHNCKGKNQKFWVNWEIWNNYRDLAYANNVQLASLNALFSLLSKKYLYVVICPSDGTYSHLTYFEENKSMRSKPKDMVLVFDVFTPELLYLCRRCCPYVWKQYGLMN